MKLVPVYAAREMVATAIVDDDDFDAVNAHRWTISGNGYAFRYGNRHQRFMHRELLGMEYGDGRLTHHRNQDRLDNRRANLEPLDNVCQHGGHIRGYRPPLAARNGLLSHMNVCRIRSQCWTCGESGFVVLMTGTYYGYHCLPCHESGAAAATMYRVAS